MTKYGFDAHDGLGYFRQVFNDTSEEKGRIDAHISIAGMTSPANGDTVAHFSALIDVTNKHKSKALHLWFYDQRPRSMLGTGSKRQAGSLGNLEMAVSPVDPDERLNVSQPFCLNAEELNAAEWDIGLLVRKSVASHKVRRLKIAQGESSQYFFATCFHEITIKPGASATITLRSSSMSAGATETELRRALATRHEEAEAAAKIAMPGVWEADFLPAASNKALLATALPNILGSIGTFRGRVPIEPAPKLREREDELTAIVPSRSFFPRGFLWDEGFHVLALLQPPMPQLRHWAVEIIGSWLKLQDPATGWIPREVPLGDEALSRVPEQFRAQSQAVANPPALIMAVATLWNTPGPEQAGLQELIRTAWLPHLRRWFDYLTKVQAAGPPASGWLWSDAPKCFRWKGRTAGHCLASGLDDYPRGLLVNEDECHLDLHAWMMLLARVLAEVSGDRSYRDTLATMRSNLFAAFRVSDQDHLLADYMSTQPVNKSTGATLVVPPWSTNGQCSPVQDCDPYSTNACCSPGGWCGNSPDHCLCQGCRRSRPLEDRPQWRDRLRGGKHSPHLGYVSLFPMLLGVLDPASDMDYLRKMAEITRRLLTPHGLASLDPADPLFRSGEDYWRGKLWGNINALAAGSLASYAALVRDRDAALSAELTELAEAVRGRWLTTVLRGLEEKHFFFENFEPARGEPRGAAPFTGWTAASVVLLLSSNDVYDATAWWRRAVMMETPENGKTQAEL